MSNQKQKVLMTEEALKIARENSKKSMPSESQKQFIEDSDREIKEIIDGNRIKFEVDETRILDLVRNGKQGEIVELEYPKGSGQFKKRARFLARDLNVDLSTERKGMDAATKGCTESIRENQSGLLCITCNSERVIRI